MFKETKKERAKRRKLDLELDRELEATFPASDALKVTLGGRPEKQVAPEQAGDVQANRDLDHSQPKS